MFDVQRQKDDAPPRCVCLCLCVNSLNDTACSCQFPRKIVCGIVPKSSLTVNNNNGMPDATNWQLHNDAAAAAAVVVVVCDDESCGRFMLLLPFVFTCFSPCVRCAVCWLFSFTSFSQLAHTHTQRPGRTFIPFSLNKHLNNFIYCSNGSESTGCLT